MIVAAVADVTSGFDTNACKATGSIIQTAAAVSQEETKINTGPGRQARCHDDRGSPHSAPRADRARAAPGR